MPRSHTFLFALLLAATAPAQGKLYWTGNDPGEDFVHRTDLDGSRREVIVRKLRFPQDVAVDTVNDHVYWTDEDRVMRANLDGTGRHVFARSGRATRGLAVDPAGGKVYWTETFNQVIQRADLDGSNVQTVASGLDFPSNLALDLQGRQIFWTEQNSRELWRANLDGTSPVLVHNNANYGVAIDPVERTLYFNWNETVFRSALDGSGRTVVRRVQGHVAGMAIDPVIGKLYVVESGPSQIERMNLDGSNLELILPFLTTPLGIDLDLGACGSGTLASSTPYGCGINPAGSLTVRAEARLGRQLRLGLDNPPGTQGPGSATLVMIAARPDPAFPCGTAVRGLGMIGGGAAGEVLVDLSRPALILPGEFWNTPGQPAVFRLRIPDECRLSGRSLFAQGLIVDAAPGARAPFALTGAVRLRLGR